MILIIDNYDSFVHNLARYAARASGDVCRVVRNDCITISEIADLNPRAIIISPGPCTPQQAGISNDVIRQFSTHIPILGVCLGHQCIGEVYGGLVLRAAQPLHGQASDIRHDGGGLFKNMTAPFAAGRYHSLIVKLQAAASPLKITATSLEGEIMALQHETYPVYGVQFHPESVLTPDGMQIMQNFAAIVDAFHRARPQQQQKAA